MSADVIATLVEWGYDVNASHGPKLRRHMFYATAFNIFVLAEHGARYNIGPTIHKNGEQFIVTPQHHLHTFIGAHNGLANEYILEKLCAVLAIGDILQVDEGSVEKFNNCLIADCLRQFCKADTVNSSVLV